MENTITLKLTLAQINVIVGALGKQPLEAVLDLFNNIKAQTETQLVEQNPNVVVEDKPLQETPTN